MHSESVELSRHGIFEWFLKGLHFSIRLVSIIGPSLLRVPSIKICRCTHGGHKKGVGGGKKGEEEGREEEEERGDRTEDG